MRRVGCLVFFLFFWLVVFVVGWLFCLFGFFLLFLERQCALSPNKKDQRSTRGRRTHQGFNDIQALHHEKPTLEAHEATKLHKRDTTSSYNEFLHYAQPYKLIPTPSTIHPVNNKTPTSNPRRNFNTNYSTSSRQP